MCEKYRGEANGKIIVTGILIKTARLALSADEQACQYTSTPSFIRLAILAGSPEAQRMPWHYRQHHDDLYKSLPLVGCNTHPQSHRHW